MLELPPWRCITAASGLCMPGLLACLSSTAKAPCLRMPFGPDRPVPLPCRCVAEEEAVPGLCRAGLLPAGLCVFCRAGLLPPGLCGLCRAGLLPPGLCGLCRGGLLPPGLCGLCNPGLCSLRLCSAGLLPCLRRAVRLACLFRPEEELG